MFFGYYFAILCFIVVVLRLSICVLFVNLAGMLIFSLAFVTLACSLPFLYIYQHFVSGF